MSEQYLLAASLLTAGVPIAASALPDLPVIDPEKLLVAWDVNKLLEPVIGQKMVPSLAVSLPEFSRPQANLETVKSVTPELPAVKQQVASGPQLYQQRLAALKAGKIYTRLATDSFESSWQKARDQPSYQQWKNLLRQEANAISSGQGRNNLSVLVGDSLSLWFPSQKLPTGKFWLNQGISGDTSTGVVKRLSAFAHTKPDTIYVMVGINDMRRGATNTAILNNHRQIIRRLRENHPQAQIILQSILPTRLAALPNSRIRLLNEQLEIIAEQEGANFLDLHTVFADAEGNLLKELTTDGLHLSERGYEIWETALQQTEYRIALTNRPLQ